MNDIAENVRILRDAIGEAAIKSGRTQESIKLVAASKTKSADMIRQAIAAGVDAIGENRVQEMMDKRTHDAYIGAPLHFIGHMQTNKVRHIVGTCDLIESVSSYALMELIGKRAEAIGIVQDVLIEVNIGHEPQKTGIQAEQTSEMLELASKTPGIRVLGLMAVPPDTGVNKENRNYYDAMFNLYIDMSAKKYDNVSMDFLSMGMSDSFADAIKAGSNMVRIGTALFGAR